MFTAGEAAIRQLIDDRVAAVRAKDRTPLAAQLSTDVVTFDVLARLMSRGSGAVVEQSQGWLDSYASDTGYEIHELDVRAVDTLGFCSFVDPVTGTLQAGDEVDMWVRATFCCERVDGEWRIVHDHESVPYDPSTLPHRSVRVTQGRGRPQRSGTTGS